MNSDRKIQEEDSFLEVLFDLLLFVIIGILECAFYRLTRK